MADTKKPGEVADRSGEWEIRGPRGGHTGQERTVARGERLPLTPERGQSYTLHRPAHNKSGRGRRRPLKPTPFSAAKCEFPCGIICGGAAIGRRRRYSFTAPVMLET